MSCSPAPTCRSARVITEYVDVANAFYDKRESGFVNGLLDAIAKEARPARAGLSDATKPSAIERLRRACDAIPRRAGWPTTRRVLDGLVLTHDMIAEGVHFLPADPPATSAGSWSR